MTKTLLFRTRDLSATMPLSESSTSELLLTHENGVLGSYPVKTCVKHPCSLVCRLDLLAAIRRVAPRRVYAVRHGRARESRRQGAQWTISGTSFTIPARPNLVARRSVKVASHSQTSISCRIPAGKLVTGAGSARAALRSTPPTLRLLRIHILFDASTRPAEQEHYSWSGRISGGLSTNI